MATKSDGVIDHINALIEEDPTAQSEVDVVDTAVGMNDESGFVQEYGEGNENSSINGPAPSSHLEEEMSLDDDDDDDDDNDLFSAPLPLPTLSVFSHAYMGPFVTKLGYTILQRDSNLH
jgi:hypothetical protein